LNGKPLVSIISAGMSKFGKRDGLLAREIFSEAASEAFSRCPKLEPKRDIKALFIGHMGEAYEVTLAAPLRIGLVLSVFQQRARRQRVVLQVLH
jgi:hypothetical protein